MARRSIFALGLGLLLAVTAVAPAAADTVAEKPRMAVLLDGAAPAFASQLQGRLAGMRRFMLVDRGSFRVRLASLGVAVGGQPTVAQSVSARGAAKVDLVLSGSMRQEGRALRVYCRLFDLRTGEFSRDLTLFGDAGSANGLASQLANFVRQTVPLRCVVKDLADDQVILDLGEADGVTVGSSYQVLRHPANVAPFRVAIVKISAVTPFASRGEVEESVKGMTIMPGDTAVERTSDLLMK